jgi:shikimate kinase/3-dehydroquinate synthase
MIRRIVLTGLSGSGKSTTGRVVAKSLNWELIDTDAEIERIEGRSIPDIFTNDGEAAFREIEAKVVRRALGRDNVVIATGGGAVLDESIWSADLLQHESSLVVWLDADAETLAQRLLQQAKEKGDAADRPLLQGDVVERLRAMRAAREAIYARADVVLDVAGRLPAIVASDIAELARLGSGEASVVELKVENAASTITVGSGTSAELGERVHNRWPRAQRIWVMIDGNVRPHIAPLLAELQKTAGAEVYEYSVPPGESSKSLDGVGSLYDWMLNGGIERGDVAIAIGGGVVGDLAGFAAATVLRGVGLVQVPTTLLSMVDSSVGGKTGINHATGKNLIGAFYQPSEVVIDPHLLESLPEREWRSGWAEIIKHAVIEPSTPAGQEPVLLSALERNLASLTNPDPLISSWLIRRNVSLKASVVAADEREVGLRAILNFGHTIGHGVEAAGYSLLHGEAVAVGICAALSIATDMDMLEPSDADRIRSLLIAYGLPTTADVDASTVRLKMAQDKKKSGGKQRWILPVSSGGVQLVEGVPEDIVNRAIASVTESK